MLDSQHLEPTRSRLTTKPRSPRRSSVPDRFRFEVVRHGDHRMEEILDLRRTAYVEAGKVDPLIASSKMTDRRDRHAWIVIAQADHRIVGTLRLAPPLPGPILGCPELGESVPGLPPGSDYLECSKVCVHPEAQGQGLFWYLAAHMLFTAREVGTPYLVGGIDRSLWHFWSRCGYRRVGASYLSRSLTGIQHWVGLLDVAASLAGRTISPKFAHLLAKLAGPG